MTIVARAPLGASTLNRKYWLDVRLPGAASFVGVHGLTEFKPKPSDPTRQDDSDMDSGGYKSSTVTAMAHGAELKVARKTQSSLPTAYDPGQEILRNASLQMGLGNRIEYRYFEMEPNGPRVEAFQGFASVGWSPDGGGMDALDTVSVTLEGQGRLVPIAHPEGAAVTALIAKATPSGAVAGAAVAIEGAGFTGTTGATGVKFGAVNATSYTVVDDTLVVAVVPAGTAGSAPITVRNSAAFPYTRGA